MANVGKTGIVRYEETFAVDTIISGTLGTNIAVPANGIAWLSCADTSDTSFVRAMSATKGLHIAGSLAATDDNKIELTGDQLMFYGQTGFNAIDVLLQADTASSLAFNFGLNSTVDPNYAGGTNLIVSLATATWYSTGSTFCGLVKDFDATNDEVHCFWVDDDVDTTESLANLRMQGASFVANKWAYMRVEMQDRGSGSGVRATFHYEQDGKTFEKVFNTSVDRDAGLCWYLGIQNRAAIARGVYVKLPSWEQSISD